MRGVLRALVVIVWMLALARISMSNAFGEPELIHFLGVFLTTSLFMYTSPNKSDCCCISRLLFRRKASHAVNDLRETPLAPPR